MADTNEKLQAMMQPADVWNRDHLATIRWLHLACNRRVVVQRQVRAGVMIIVEVIGEDPLQVALVEHDEVVEALAADRADDSLDVR